ncbi:MAG: hypothetical protein DHS20C07_12890 [Methyloligella sp.]|jgi:hypothetical protein|nr:MAG: hypothetical protein DHS20C07_12890 [Methyloligella sp.]
MTEEEQKKRKRRSLVIGLVLAAFVVLFYAITIIRLGENVVNRPL